MDVTVGASQAPRMCAVEDSTRRLKCSWRILTPLAFCLEMGCYSRGMKSPSVTLGLTASPPPSARILLVRMKYRAGGPGVRGQLQPHETTLRLESQTQTCHRLLCSSPSLTCPEYALYVPHVDTMSTWLGPSRTHEATGEKGALDVVTKPRPLVFLKFSSST